MKEKDKLSPRQIAAINVAAKVGKLLQVEHPEIANLYREGHTRPEIVDLRGLNKVYGITPQNAVSAVCFALRGYDGNDRCEEYAGLLEESELATLCKEHRSESGEKMAAEGSGLFSLTQEETRANKSLGGKTTLAKKHGIFTLTPEQRGQNTRQAYKEGKNWWAQLSHEERVAHGKSLHERRVGIHKLDSEGKRAAALKGMEVLGLIPWSPSEDEYLLGVLRSKEYTVLSGGMLKRDYTRIVTELNTKFHTGQSIRTRVATRGRLIDLNEQIPRAEKFELGSIPWTNAEQGYLSVALTSGKYIREYKPGNWTYDYNQLAADLNKFYHNGQDVRRIKATRAQLLKLKNKKS